MAKLQGQLFARLALDYFDHPKIAALSDAAIVAHLEMIVYCRRYRTDGRVPNRIANRFGSGSLSELASNDAERPSIAIHDDGSITVHDYAEYQETREQIDARRQVNASNGAKGGRPAKRNKTQSVSESRTQRGTQKKAETETETETEIPTPNGVGRRGTRAHPLPVDWQPTAEHRALAAERGIDCDREAAAMRDWATDKGATGKDWDARFRNWLRRATPDRQSRHRDADSRDALLQAHFDMEGRP